MSLLIFLMSLLGCNTGFRSMEVEQFEIAIQADSVMLVDVRTPQEYASGHLKNAVNIDVNASDFAEQIQTLDKEKTIAVYCRSGRRSKKAANILTTNGYKVIELNSGYIGWQQAGKQTTQD